MQNYSAKDVARLNGDFVCVKKDQAALLLQHFIFRFQIVFFRKLGRFQEALLHH